jgi:hypothetical protein
VRITRQEKYQENIAVNPIEERNTTDCMALKLRIEKISGDDSRRIFMAVYDGKE